MIDNEHINTDNIMQGVMTLDLTKILSDKCYSLKTALSDKFKIKKVYYTSFQLLIRVGFRYLVHWDHSKR